MLKWKVHESSGCVRLQIQLLDEIQNGLEKKSIWRYWDLASTSNSDPPTESVYHYFQQIQIKQIRKQSIIEETNLGRQGGVRVSALMSNGPHADTAFVQTKHVTKQLKRAEFSVSAIYSVHDLQAPKGMHCLHQQHKWTIPFPT